MKIAKSKIKKFLQIKQNNKCYYCGCDLQNHRISLDHIKPKFKGGKDIIDNFRICCLSCNTRKNTRTIEEFRRVAYFHKNNIPYFNNSQLEWLCKNSNDFLLIFNKYKNHKFYFEIKNKEVKCE